jgi:protein gp37
VGESTLISWAHNTQNFWYGCDKIDPLCAHCYIDRILQKMHKEPWGEVYRAKSTWGDPAKWQIKAEREGVCYRIFTCSLSDFFHAKADPWRAEAWQIIKHTPNLVWLILTKRPERILRCLPPDWPYPNAWLFVSVGTVQTLNKMDVLRKISVHERAIRGISAEPLLEDISGAINLDGFHFVITGGESGDDPEYLWDAKANWRSEFNIIGRRTMKLEWAANLRDVTKKAGLSFFFKQITARRSGVGPDALGRLWQEYPPPPLDLPWADQPQH